MSSFSYRITDALHLLGIPFSLNRTSFNIPCPVCDTGSNSSHLNINLKKDTFRCPRCGDVQGGVLDLYALYAGCSRKEAYRALSDNAAVFTHPVKRQTGTDDIDGDSIASVSMRNFLYGKVLDALTLSDVHRKNLKERGLNDSDIEYYRFRSSDPARINEMLSPVIKETGQLKGIPGFYKSMGQWRFKCDYSGILIPVLNVDGMIEGLQLRLDNTENRKYRWISSGELENGTAGKSFTHFIGTPDRTVILTEGPLKADVIHSMTGSGVIAVPGVNCLSHLKPVLDGLKERGVEHIVTAFDMDSVSNPHVDHGYCKLVELLNSMDFTYATFLWNPSYKGLDDYLLHCRQSGQI